MARTIQALRHTPLALRLVRKLKALDKFPHEWKHDSRYALMGMSPGHWQKSAGAWSWELWQLDNMNEWRPTYIGGSEPASLMVKNTIRLSWYINNGSVEVCAEYRRYERLVAWRMR